MSGSITYPPPADARLHWDAVNARCDLSMWGGGPLLETGNDLQTAILISLFTDQVADPGDVVPPDMLVDPRGWWADTYNGYPIGSKLWQVLGRVTNQDTLNFARDTAAKSLQWLIDDGVAGAVDVVASYYGRGGLLLNIAVTQATGVTMQFSFVWQFPAGAPHQFGQVIPSGYLADPTGGYVADPTGGFVGGVG